MNDLNRLGTTGDWKRGQEEPAADPAPPGNAGPSKFGRYRVVKVLGEGGFGRVYLAQDEQLRRLVAVKVLHRHRVSRPEDVEGYLAEARVLASLDHPNILPVHDVGRTDDGLCYIVSKFIEGNDLEKTIKEGRPSFHESTALVQRVAAALHYAHRKGVVHRDIKPATILLDASGKPYVADFGLALREEDFGRGPQYAGTPAYLSPEQARGEGHWVDGRSDIFSLGVVLYELLTGRRPFQGETRDELLEQITTVEPRPPRQIDDTIPKELERICLKAMSKRASDRYTTAKDLAQDLSRYLERGSGHRPPRPQAEAPAPNAGTSPPRHRGKAKILAVTCGLGLILAAEAYIVFWPALWLYFTSLRGDPTGIVESEDFRITSIRTASEDCTWEPIYEADTITGFKRGTGPLADRVFTKREFELETGYLPIVHRYFQGRLSKAAAGAAGRSEGGHIIRASPYEAFRDQVSKNHFKGGSLFTFIRSIWPGREDLEELHKQDPEAYDALHDFRLHFLRDRHPIFDVIVENRTANDIVIHSASLYMRNVRVYVRSPLRSSQVVSVDGALGGKVLEISAEYDWRLVNLKDKKFIAWFKAHPITFDGVDTYRGPALVSRFELDPPLIAKANRPLRFQIRFVDGYDCPCDIRFVFRYGKENGAASQWFRFLEAEPVEEFTPG